MQSTTPRCEAQHLTAALAGTSHVLPKPMLCTNNSSSGSLQPLHTAVSKHQQPHKALQQVPCPQASPVTNHRASCMQRNAPMAETAPNTRSHHRHSSTNVGRATAVNGQSMTSPTQGTKLLVQSVATCDLRLGMGRGPAALQLVHVITLACGTCRSHVRDAINQVHAGKRQTTT